MIARLELPKSLEMRVPLRSLAIVLLAVSTGLAQGPPTRQTDAERERLRGAVKSVVTEEVVAASGKGTPLERLTFDEAGNLVERARYVRGELVETATYRPTPEGHRVERIVRPGGVRRTRLRPRVPTGPQPVVDETGAEVRVVALTFNSAGRLISETVHYGLELEAQKAVAKNQYRYDRNGRVTERLEYEGTPMRSSGRAAYSYGERELPVDEVTYGANFQNARKTTFEYEVDDRGNWVVRRETAQPEDGEGPRVLRRTIVYFSTL